jgi:hypothetical protein
VTDRTSDGRLTEAQLQEFSSLVPGADSVELKVTVPASGARAAAASMGMDTLGAQIRQVFFFDTPALTLNENGVVVRARRIQGKPNDTVIKLRPVVPDELPPELRSSPNLGVEIDAMPGGFVCSASMKRTLKGDKTADVAAGERPIHKLFSKEQRAFFSEYAPRGFELDDLQILGPIFVLKLKHVPKGFKRKLVGEMWVYPDGSRIVELSTKCAPEEAFDVAAEARAFLGGHGVDLNDEQQTKTKTALEYFANELAADARAD